MSKRSVILDMKSFADAVKVLAFKMPPPNEWTPQFVQLAQAAHRIAIEHEIEDRKERKQREALCQRTETE